MKSNQSSDTLNLDWPTLLAAWKDSGLSGSEFCRQQGLSYYQFGYWKKKLYLPSQTRKPKPSAFIKVESSSVSSTTAGLTITLPSGAVIQGVTDANIGLVYQLLALR